VEDPRRGHGRIVWVGGLCLAAVWSVPAVRVAQGHGELVLDLLPELLFGTAAFAVVLILWRSALESHDRERLRNLSLSEELESQTLAVRNANERLVQRSQELTDEVSSIHARAERAEESNRRKSEFLVNVGKDVRTAVHEVLEGAESIADATRDPQIADSARAVGRSGRGLLDMIDDVLDFSAIEAERVELEDASYDLRALIESALVSMAHRGSSPEVEWACMIDPDLPRALRGDRGRVRQILMNFLTNAAKGMEAGTIQTRVDRKTVDGVEFVSFEVSDDGKGIEAERLATIFEDTSSQSRDGLGLLICARLARLMGGDIGADSRGDAGSVFWVRVPLRAGEARALKRVEKDVAGSRVLVVSGSSALRLMCIQQLRECGCVPAASADGPSALASLRAAATAGDPFRIVLSDIDVPGGSGLGFADVIHREDTFGRPAVAILVHVEDHEGIKRIDSVPSVRRMPKPVKIDELRELVVDTLRSPLERDEVEVVDHIAPAVQEAAERVHREENENADKVSARSGRVLVVDDNPVNRRVASLILKRAGYPVEIAEDGQIAVERIEAEEPFDLILMDVHMPRLNGFEATARIREMDPERAKIPIVAMTASAMSGDAERCIKSGMDGYVSKPVKAEALVAVVESWIPEEVDDGTATASDRTETTSEDEAIVTLDPAGIEELRALSGGDATMLNELLDSFFETAAEHVRSMRSAIGEGDLPRVAESAHGLRGSAGTIGAQKLYEMTSRLEEEARTAGATIDPSRIDAVESEVQAVRVALDRLLTTPA